MKQQIIDIKYPLTSRLLISYLSGDESQIDSRIEDFFDSCGVFITHHFDCHPNRMVLCYLF